MNRIELRIIEIVVVAFLLAVSALAQLPACVSKNLSETDSKLPECHDLKSFDLKGIRVCMPKDFEAEKSTHHSVYAFLRANTQLVVDVDMVSNGPTIERRKPSYQESVVQREKAIFWKWSIEDRMGWKYVEGLHIWDSEKEVYRARILLVSNEKIPAALSSSIFDSVCLVKP